MTSHFVGSERCVLREGGESEEIIFLISGKCLVCKILTQPSSPHVFIPSRESSIIKNNTDTHTKKMLMNNTDKRKNKKKFTCISYLLTSFSLSMKFRINRNYQLTLENTDISKEIKVSYKLFDKFDFLLFLLQRLDRDVFQHP